MKIYFNASKLGQGEFGENYKKVIAAIEKTDNQVLMPSKLGLTTEKLVKTKLKEAVGYYTEMETLLKKAEVAVFETSYPSTSIGHEIALALHLSKPVVALHVKTAPKNPVLASLQNDRLQAIDYAEDRVDKVVEEAIDYATEQMDTRFNFFISPDIGNYLDWVSKYKKLPRAVFLRQLIESDMVKQGYEG